MSEEKQSEAVLPVSPLARRALYQFYEPDGEVAAELNSEVRLGCRWITNVWVKHTHRRQGLGRQMMKAFVRDFDAEPLFLHVLAYDGRTMYDDKLLAFYESFGFGPTEVPDIMKRPPSFTLPLEAFV